MFWSVRSVFRRRLNNQTIVVEMDMLAEICVIVSIWLRTGQYCNESWISFMNDPRSIHLVIELNDSYTGTLFIIIKGSNGR